LKVELTGVQPTVGPISAYQIVVIDESSPVIFKPELLGDYEKAESEGTPYYVAAEIPGVVSVCFLLVDLFEVNGRDQTFFLSFFYILFCRSDSQVNSNMK
jgi:hypothetical protein